MQRPAGFLHLRIRRDEGMPAERGMKVAASSTDDVELEVSRHRILM